ncbi:MAG: hypothetical protein Q7R87_00495, partial [Nanoarchaeota archaeon]|nr:hypothetical protein [Nanoarchaeota archaeon]
DDFGGGRPAIRILSDRGIKQAVREGFLILKPELDFDNLGERLQPATLDLKVGKIDSYYDPGTATGGYCEDLTLRANQVSWISFADDIAFSVKKGMTPQGSCFFDKFLDGRSSLLRLGGVVCGNPDPCSFLGLESTIFHYAPNDLHFDSGERIAQAFIRVMPFAETYLVPFDVGDKPPYTLQGEEVRALDMGVQAKNIRQLKGLAEAGLMKVERGNGGEFDSWNGLILLHAKDAFRMKKVEGGIKFSERSKYSHENLFEPVDIRNKYDIREGEHLVVEVEEKFELSDKVGISVFNNLVGRNVPGAPKLRGFAPLDLISGDEGFRQGQVNLSLINKRNSWIDPGYNGMMTAFPKLLGKSVQKGDIVGYGQVFYFPKGVERPYGNKELGSQYQGQEKFQLTAK